MILCLDAGNSRLKWGVRTQGAWLAQGVCAHADCARLATALPPGIARILACNVAGETLAANIEQLAAQLGAALAWFRSSAACCGVTNGYDNPAQLGADRWAALIGAHALLGRRAEAALVVTAGTATTIDVLSADGLFRGGLILPGLDLMRKSLARNTAGLPEARGVYRELPTQTDDAIISGALQATLGAIARMRPLNATVLLSGGAAAALLPHIALPVRLVDHLVLAGLARVADGC